MAAAIMPLSSAFKASQISFDTKPDSRRQRALKKGDWNDSLSPSIPVTPVTDDPLRILAPAQKKLSTIESQRVLGVMDETIKRLEGVALLSQLTGSLERLSVSLGSELVLLLEEYKQLVDRYNTLYLALKPTGSTSSVDCVSSRLHLARGSFGTPLGSKTSLTSREGSFVRLEPLDIGSDEEISEERLVATGGRLRHVVRCILRGLKENPISLQSIGKNNPNRTLLDAMRFIKL